MAPVVGEQRQNGMLTSATIEAATQNWLTVNTTWFHT
jgi:hypothetical protein